MNPAAIPAVLAALVAGAVAGLLLARRTGGPRWPWLTLLMTLLTAAAIMAETAEPRLGEWLSRSPALVQRVELWRLITPLFFQAGDLPGLVFNLFWLIVLGLIAERAFTRRVWLIVYLGGGTITELLALIWQPTGAGNSIACFALAGALSWRTTSACFRRTGAVLGAIGGAAAIWLLLLRDIHGIGFVVGAFLSMIPSLGTKRAASEPISTG